MNKQADCGPSIGILVVSGYVYTWYTMPWFLPLVQINQGGKLKVM